MKSSTFEFMRSSVAAERRALDALYEQMDEQEFCKTLELDRKSTV